MLEREVDNLLHLFEARQLPAGGLNLVKHLPHTDLWLVRRCHGSRVTPQTISGTLVATES